MTREHTRPSWGGWSRRGLLHAVYIGNATACGKWVEQSFDVPEDRVSEYAKCKSCKRIMATTSGGSGMEGT